MSKKKEVQVIHTDVCLVDVNKSLSDKFRKETESIGVQLKGAIIGIQEMIRKLPAQERIYLVDMICSEMLAGSRLPIYAQIGLIEAIKLNITNKVREKVETIETPVIAEPKLRTYYG